MDVLIVFVALLFLGQVNPITWVDIIDIAKPVFIALLTLVAVKFMTPSLNKADDRFSQLEKRIEERLGRGEAERKDLINENNLLWKTVNEQNKEIALLKEKEFNHKQWMANELANIYKTIARVEARIDDFRTFLKTK